MFHVKHSFLPAFIDVYLYSDDNIIILFVKCLIFLHSIGILLTFSFQFALMVRPLSVASFAPSQRIIQKQPAGTFLPASRMFHVEQFHFPDGSSSSGSCSKSGFITSSPADSS